jgi:hypothetical protein
MESNLSEKSVLFTGSFELDPKRYAAQLGVTLTTSVSPDVSWIVAGRTPSTIRLAQAQQLGIPQLDEAGFFEVVGLQDKWREHDQAKAARQEQREREEAECRKRREEYATALELKRATMPHTRTTVDIITECYHSGTARLVDDDNLTADELREAIRNGENEPHIVRDEDGTFFLVNAEFRGDRSIYFNPEETEVILYEDGTFETIDEFEGDEDEDDADETDQVSEEA